MQYIFVNRIIGGPIWESDPENLTIQRMTRIWEQFALTGNPNKADDEFLQELNWNPFNASLANYMEIGQHFIEKNGLFLDRYHMWNEVFPLNSTST